MKKNASVTLTSGKYVSLRAKELADGRQSLYLHIYQGGKRKKYFLNRYLTKNKEADKDVLREARALRAQKENELLTSNDDFIPEFKKHGDFVEYFRSLTKKAGNCAWQNTLNYLEKFTDGKPVTFKNVTPQWLKGLQEYLLSQVRINSAGTYYSKIKAALNKAVKEKIIQRNPASEIDNIRDEQTMREYLVLEELQQLAKAACPDEEVKKAFLFSAFTGLRISDITKLTWKEVQGDQLEFRQKKTKSVTYIPLPRQAKAYLGERGEPSEPVFKLVNYQRTRNALRQWVKAAGINKNITFHSARHTYATLALTFGVDIYTVKELLGHSDIRHTQIYAKIISHKKRAAVDLLPVLEG